MRVFSSLPTFSPPCFPLCLVPLFKQDQSKHCKICLCSQMHKQKRTRELAVADAHGVTHAWFWHFILKQLLSLFAPRAVMPMHRKRSKGWAVLSPWQTHIVQDVIRASSTAVTPGVVSTGKSWTDATSVQCSHQLISCHDSQAFTCVSGYLCRKSLSPAWFCSGRLPGTARRAD